MGYNEGMNFADYMTKVDGFLLRRVGMSSIDLPDFEYWAAWDDDETPAHTARRALANAGYNAEHRGGE